MDTPTILPNGPLDAEGGGQAGGHRGALSRADGLAHPRPDGRAHGLARVAPADAAPHGGSCAPGVPDAGAHPGRLPAALVHAAPEGEPVR